MPETVLLPIAMTLLAGDVVVEAPPPGQAVMTDTDLGHRPTGQAIVRHQAELLWCADTIVGMGLTFALTHDVDDCEGEFYRWVENR
ncbi:hypothetical protein V9K92_14960 [Phyllobacterium sp. CCNWLW109]|uniref:hypothetical protein n=1 Tax=Phyllobacterium sp. CCNWLW109 TaxID=3127479 RepID=UPI00307797B1